jgi:hypothetical protein
MNPQFPDPPIDEIRAIRSEISARFDHDLDRLVAHDVEFQKQFGGRLLTHDPRLIRCNEVRRTDDDQSR